MHANGNKTPNGTPNNPTLAPGDQLCQCIDAGKRPECLKEFVFTVGEQKFFNEKGFTPPKRCKPCRDAKRAEKEGGTGAGAGGGGYHASGGYSSGNGGGGGGGGGYSGGGYGDGGGGGKGKKRRRDRDERDY